MWMDLVVTKLMLVKLSHSLMHTSPSPNKECTQQGVCNNGGEERYDYKVYNNRIYVIIHERISCLLK